MTDIELIKSAYNEKFATMRENYDALEKEMNGAIHEHMMEKVRKLLVNLRWKVIEDSLSSYKDDSFKVSLEFSLDTRSIDSEKLKDLLGTLNRAPWPTSYSELEYNPNEMYGTVKLKVWDITKLPQLSDKYKLTFDDGGLADIFKYGTFPVTKGEANE